MKPIVFSEHALLQIKNRKVTKEVRQTIQEGIWQSAKKGRLTCARTFAFEAEHYGRFYRSKQVVPIFVEEEKEIVVITVYTFFSQKEAF